MNYAKAVKSLNLTEPFTKKDIKKAYYSLAIKYHPDKSIHENDTNQKFLEIKEAYDLLNILSNIDFEEDEDDANDYISLLKKCIKLVSPNTNWSNLFMDTTFKNIINDCQNISLKIFKGLDKEKSIEIFTFLSTYKKIFHIREDTLEKMKEIVKDKRKNDNLVLLCPSLDDLFNQKIYILNICKKQFYIPLWCHELGYDISGDDLIVKCDPILPDDVEIDDNNNIFINVKRNISDVLKEDIIFHLGSNEFKIPSSELLIKPKQIHCLYNEGIPKFNQENIYEMKKAHIYVNIYLS